MSENRWHKLQSMFNAALDLPAEQRNAYLLKESEGDESLFDEVIELLKADEGDDLDNLDPRNADKESTPVGQTLGPYVILEEVGKGGMGVVYKAQDTRLERFLGLKCLTRQLCMDPSARARFLNEARAASRLDHPNICAIYDVGETECGQMYLAMPFYEGETLLTRMSKTSISMTESLTIAGKMAQGLSAAHDKGIYHRDIKPSNVMLTKSGGVVILDFGVAKIMGVDITRIGSLMGTAAYMAPEQICSDHVDQRTDIWSLGVVLYEMLCGVKPFEGKSTHEIMRAVLGKRPKPPSEHQADIPSDLEHVVLKMLKRDPKQRYQSLGECTSELTVDRWLKPLVRDNADHIEINSDLSLPVESAWPDKTLGAISKELVMYLGPIAAIIVKKEAKKAENLSELGVRLASYLNEQDSDRFRRNYAKLDLEDRVMQVRSLQQVCHKIKLDGMILDRIESALTEIVGPVAKPMVKRNAKSVTTVDELCKVIAQQLSSDDEKQAYYFTTIKARINQDGAGD